MEKKFNVLTIFGVIFLLFVLVLTAIIIFLWKFETFFIVLILVDVLLFILAVFFFGFRLIARRREKELELLFIKYPFDLEVKEENFDDEIVYDKEYLLNYKIFLPFRIIINISLKNKERIDEILNNPSFSYVVSDNYKNFILEKEVKGKKGILPFNNREKILRDSEISDIDKMFFSYFYLVRLINKSWINEEPKRKKKIFDAVKKKLTKEINEVVDELQKAGKVSLLDVKEVDIILMTKKAFFDESSLDNMIMLRKKIEEKNIRDYVGLKEKFDKIYSAVVNVIVKEFLPDLVQYNAEKENFLCIPYLKLKGDKRELEKAKKRKKLFVDTFITFREDKEFDSIKNYSTYQILKNNQDDPKVRLDVSLLKCMEEIRVNVPVDTIDTIPVRSGNEKFVEKISNIINTDLINSGLESYEILFCGKKFSEMKTLKGYFNETVNSERSTSVYPYSHFEKQEKRFKNKNFLPSLLTLYSYRILRFIRVMRKYEFFGSIKDAEESIKNLFDAKFTEGREYVRWSELGKGRNIFEFITNYFEKEDEDKILLNFADDDSILKFKIFVNEPVRSMFIHQPVPSGKLEAIRKELEKYNGEISVVLKKYLKGEKKDFIQKTLSNKFFSSFLFNEDIRTERITDESYKTFVKNYLSIYNFLFILQRDPLNFFIVTKRENKEEETKEKIENISEILCKVQNLNISEPFKNFLSSKPVSLYLIRDFSYVITTTLSSACPIR